MISAQLIKNLEKYGFGLDFPSEDSNKLIIDILNENSPRLNLAIPLLLKDKFDYNKIISKLNQKLKKELNNIILITNQIFINENINNSYLDGIIKKKHINSTINKEEFKYYYDSFKDFNKNLELTNEKDLEKQINRRNTLNLNKTLSILFSPGKLRIMKKIYDYEFLSNTELKYYYRSIRPVCLAISNQDLQKYAAIIESAKKHAN